MNIGIYKITNPSGKIYIGQSININYRENWYKKLYCKKQPKLYKSIMKYGWVQHLFEIIEECSLEQLNERETYWKQYYLDLFNGDWKKVLFCGLYDTGGGPKSKETKLKMSKSRLGKKDSNETKKKKSESFKGRKGSIKQKEIISKYWKNNPIRTIEIGIKISNTKKEKTKYKTKPFPKKDVSKFKTNVSVIQCDLNDKEIKEFISINEASRQTGIRHDTISACVRGKQKTTGGYKWKYK